MVEGKVCGSSASDADLSSCHPVIPSSLHQAAPSAWRAWHHLVWLSWQRQARAHLMVWIALGLLAFTLFIVYLNTYFDRWNTSYWRRPPRTGPTYAQYLFEIKLVGTVVADPSAQAIGAAMTGAVDAALFKGSGFFVFSNGVVFSVFATFLMPLWCLCFATEALGRDREARTLIWLLIRPLPRWSIYLAKFTALLPWSLGLTMGGFALICAAAPTPGRLAFHLYWPAVLMGSLAFCALFHLMGALFRRAAVVAILYSFFAETFLGNLPGHIKRLSLSFYTRCLMFERAHDVGIRPERPDVYLPVSGPVALAVLVAVTLLALVAGMVLFSRREYLDLTG